MTWNYAYTPLIWPSVLTVLLLIALAVFAWRRRSVPGASPFAISCLFAVLLVAGNLMAYLAVDEETSIFWNKFADMWWLPGATASTCYILEYAWPGRWLSRRNLALLSIVPLLGALYILTGNFFDLIPDYIRVSGTMLESFGQVGGILFIYSLVLALINFIVFTWLFAHSPQHRWPVFIMATGQIVTRILLVRSSPELDAWLLYVPEFVFAYLAYAIALFGFRIFDPVPLARQSAIDQMHTGMLVLDLQGRVASLNLSAERILGASAKEIKGRSIRELLPAYPEGQVADQDDTETEFCLGTGQDADGPAVRYYTLAISLLKDFRGLEVGHLLMLRDITEQKQAQAQIVEQQRVLATQDERERMARDLHDSLGQVLGYAGFQVEAAAKLSRDGNGDDVAAQLDRLGSVIREAHADLREVILNLRSAPSLQQPFFTLVKQYLQGFTSNYDIQTHVTIPPQLGEEPFGPDAQLQVFRILQEALSNARKHGQARHVEVSFASDDGRVRMTIQDDGRGFSPGDLRKDGEHHYGLQFMQERAGQLGGCLQVESSPGSGTHVVLNVPRKEI